MPGERMPQGNKGIIGYLRALQEFDKQFPCFEHEIQALTSMKTGTSGSERLWKKNAMGSRYPAT